MIISYLAIILLLVYLYSILVPLIGPAAAVSVALLLFFVFTEGIPTE